MDEKKTRDQTFPPSTGPYAGPKLPLNSGEDALLLQCALDLFGRGITTSLYEGEVARRTDAVGEARSVAPSPSLFLTAFESMNRAARLETAAPLLISLVDRITDAHVDAAVEAAGLQDNLGWVEARARASRVGGFASTLQRLVVPLEDVFSWESKVSKQLYVAAASALAPIRSVVSPFDPTDRILGGLMEILSPPKSAIDYGCVLGAIEGAVGVYIIEVAATAELGTLGAATPGAVFAGAAGVALLGAGASTVSAHCF